MIVDQGIIFDLDVHFDDLYVLQDESMNWTVYKFLKILMADICVFHEPRASFSITVLFCSMAAWMK